MNTPYEIDHKLSKENAARIARQVENHRALPGDQDKKAEGGVLAMVVMALGAVLAFVRSA